MLSFWLKLQQALMLKFKQHFLPSSFFPCQYVKKLAFSILQIHTGYCAHLPSTASLNIHNSALKCIFSSATLAASVPFWFFFN